jgi:hypothetical protein
MGKRTKIKAGLLASAARVHPVIAQAALTPEQAARCVYAVAKVANPLGEVTVQGDIRQHKACRRVPMFETLYRSKVIDDAAFIVLGWYADRLGLAMSGLFKSALNVSGSGGGSANSHTPASLAATEARSDIAWARSFIRPGLLPIFDGVMVEEESFAAIGRRLYPNLANGWRERRVSSEYKAAVQMLGEGIGHLIKLGNVA